MDFRKLSYFEAVCRVQSFTRAAELLHVSQPSVTMAVRDLERELNVRLLNRNRGKLALTTEGEFVLKKARSLVHALEEADEDIQTFLAQKQTCLRVGYAMQMQHCLSSLLEDFQSACQTIQIIEQESPSLAVIAQVRDGTLDLGVISVFNGLDQTVCVEPLFQGELRICISRQNPLCQRESLTLEEFERQPLVAMTLNDPQDSYIFHHLRDAYPDQKVVLKPQATSLMLGSYFQHIKNNDGIGLTYYDIWYSPAEELEALNCTMLPFSPACRYQTAIIYAKDRSLSSQAKQLIRYLKDARTASAFESAER